MRSETAEMKEIVSNELSLSEIIRLAVYLLISLIVSYYVKDTFSSEFILLIPSARCLLIL